MHRTPGRHLATLAILGVLRGDARSRQVAEEELPAARRLFALVRPVYSGERARRVVEYMEQFWRHPGNHGFDASLDHVASVLRSAGFVEQQSGSGDARLAFWIERRKLEQPTWEPDSASLTIVGQRSPLLRFSSNRNMLAINSFSTLPSGVEGELVDVGNGTSEEIEQAEVAGKIVLGETGAARLFSEAVQKRGALGVLAYTMPRYTKPESNQESIQFGRIPLDPSRRSWAIQLSFGAREALRSALSAGPVRLRVATSTRIYEAEDRTLIAEVRGSQVPDERFVFSAHVQEPGANDNGSGVGAQAEMARVSAALVRAGSVSPRRTLTFIWGSEIAATQRYLADSARASGVRWGMSLDMVGENTAITGGTFLIEKMPDPSAVWTRGEDRHTEWGGEPLTVDQLTPHYFNDFVLQRCLEQAATNGWVVNTNPYEGGSDHVPFLRAKKPAVLLWHFTDVFYHTDGDRLRNVSATTLANVGVSALTAALTLASADGEAARGIVGELVEAARARLDKELALSRAAVKAGGDRSKEELILRTWADWYRGAIRAAEEIEVGGASEETRTAISAAEQLVTVLGDEAVGRL